MFRLRQSLLLKLILAFWLVSILGIGVVAFLAGRVSTLEFTRFVNESRYQGLVDNLSDYYIKNGNFSGAKYLLEADRASTGGGNREYLVMDAQGNILVSLAQHIPPGLPSTELIRFGFPIPAANGGVAAYLIPLRPTRSPAETATANLQRLNLNLLIGVDVSDSTNAPALREAFARELMQIARGRDAVLTVLYANSRIQRIESFRGSSVVPASYHGGGFTDLRPVFDYARTMQPRPAAVVYLTDGIGPVPEQMEFPTLWVLTREGEKPVPWGVELRLDV